MHEHGSRYFARRHTLDPGGGVKSSKHFFLKVVMYHNRLKEMEHRAPCKHTSCPYIHHRPLGCGKNMKTVFFSESNHVAYQI